MDTENVNYHNIRYNLRLLKEETNTLTNLNSWILFLNKFEAFIYSYRLLKENYVSSVKSYHEVRLRGDVREFLDQFLQNFIDFEFDVVHSYSTICYFEPIENVKNINTVYNLVDLYLQLSNSPMTDENMQFIVDNNGILKNMCCYLLAYNNIKDYAFRKVNEEFATLYLKTLFIEVYEKMEQVLNNHIWANEYNNPSLMIIINLKTKIKNNPRERLTADLINLLDYLYNNPLATVEQIVDKLNLREKSNLDLRIKRLLFYLTGEEKGGKQKLLKLLKLSK